MTEFLSLQNDNVELPKKNPAYFLSYMRMCWTLNSCKRMTALENLRSVWFNKKIEI